jgi:predicted PurR-regulated permease PerM
VPDNQNDKFSYDRLTATSIELMVRLGVLGLLLYWSFTLLRPFITIAIWSVVLTVALYPAYNYLVAWLGGRRRLAAALLTCISLIIVIGPATWLVMSLIDTIKILSTQLELSTLVLPLPPSLTRVHRLRFCSQRSRFPARCRRMGAHGSRQVSRGYRRRARERACIIPRHVAG